MLIHNLFTVLILSKGIIDAITTTDFCPMFIIVKESVMSKITICSY